MRLLKYFVATMVVGVSSIAFAQDGCFYSHENSFLQVGAMRSFLPKGEQMCSKLLNGTYVWVEVNDFDRSGGCWYQDKYPVSAIKEMFGVLKQCVKKQNSYEWVEYKK